MLDGTDDYRSINTLVYKKCQTLVEHKHFCYKGAFKIG